MSGLCSSSCASSDSETTGHRRRERGDGQNLAKAVPAGHAFGHRSEYPSLKALIELSCKKFADRVAYLQMDHRLSYAELDSLSARFGAWLQSQGLKRGDRIAIMLPNILQYPVVMCGALRAGLAVVNTNPLYTERELEYQLRDSGATALVVLENFASIAQQALPSTAVRHVIVTAVGDLLAFPKGALVNFVLRHVQRKIPAWKIEGSRSLKSILSNAPETLKPVSSIMKTSPIFNTPGVLLAYPRARC